MFRQLLDTLGSTKGKNLTAEEHLQNSKDSLKVLSEFNKMNEFGQSSIHSEIERRRADSLKKPYDAKAMQEEDSYK